MVYAFFLKVLFNACTKSFSKGDKVGYDKWAVLDITSAVATLIIFPFMANSPAQVFLNKESKALMDYIVSGLIILQLTRFFSFMLLVLEMSKLLLTVYAMLVDTVPFVLLTLMYLYISAAFLYTLYSDINPGKYGTIEDTVITIFDDLMGSYGYGGFGKEYEYSHSIWLLITVYGANILFLNYLVAILSESYAAMLDQGLFLYKVLLY